jgi:hypothetical protein
MTLQVSQSAACIGSVTYKLEDCQTAVVSGTSLFISVIQKFIAQIYHKFNEFGIFYTCLQV